MKILFNCRCLKKGGAERVISTLANSLIRDNEITIVTSVKDNIDYDIDKNIKVVTVDKNRSNSGFISKLKKISINSIIRLKKIIISEKPDIIISFLPEPSLKIMLLKSLDKQINKIPTIVSIRNDPKIEYNSSIKKIIVKKIYKKVDCLVLQTEEAMDFFSNIIPKEKMTIIPNPINPIFLINEEYKGKRDKRIVTVGRLEKQKNHELLIKAFKKVEMIYNDYTLEIFGDGNLKNELMELIEKLDLNNKVILKGATDDVKSNIYNASIFVLSSKYEGMPNALMEALALGIPCVSTDCPCGGPKFLINNNINGILVKNEDVNELSQAIIRLIEDKKFAQKIGKQANKDSKRFEVSKIVELWSDVINNIVSCR